MKPFYYLSDFPERRRAGEELYSRVSQVREKNILPFRAIRDCTAAFMRGATFTGS